jgi:hypothetical protein
MRDFRDAKAMAQRLREALGAKRISITHGESLELVSRMLGAPDWNTLSAVIKDNQPKPVAVTPSEEEQTTPDDRARLLAEQQAPRSVAAFDPRRFDKYVGHYELGRRALTVTRDGGRFFSGFLGQEPPTEFYPESETKFFATDVAAQVSFVTDARGAVTELVIHQNGRELHARRIDEATFKSMADALAQRIASITPSPGAEEVLRRHIESRVNGAPDFDVMVPELAAVARQQWQTSKPAQLALGALKSIKFVGVTERGFDEYRVRFEHGAWYWMISPLGPDGKAWGLGGRPADEAP